MCVCLPVELEVELALNAAVIASGEIDVDAESQLAQPLKRERGKGNATKLCFA